MKSIVTALLIATIYFAPKSQAEILYAPDHTCADLQQTVATQGAADIQMRFGFGHYVSSQDACGGPFYSGNGMVFGTADAEECEVGYVCRQDNGGGNG